MESPSLDETRQNKIRFEDPPVVERVVTVVSNMPEELYTSRIESWKALIAPDFPVYEPDLWLHPVAVMVDRGYFRPLAQLLSRQFEVSDPLKSMGNSSLFTVFLCRSKILFDHNQKNRLHANYQGSLCRERVSEESGLSTGDLVQADALLSIRAMLAQNDYWFPHLIPGRKPSEEPPLFAAAQEHRGFEDLAVILGIGNKSEIVEAAGTAKKNPYSSSKNAMSLLNIPLLDSR